MKRKIFLYENLLNKNILEITDNEVINRIVNVYRLKIGEGLIFIGKDLIEGYYNLKNKSKNKLIFELQQLISRKILPKREINFYVSFIRKENFELILNKSFELGVKKIIPLKTERSPWFVNKVSERWLKILYKGLEIADWNYLPEIDNPIEVKNLPQNIYVLSENGNLISNTSFDSKISIVIGPEGGFSSKDLRILKSKNSKFISLGQINLKSETAFFISCALLNFN